MVAVGAYGRMPDVLPFTLGDAMDRMFCYLWHEKNEPNECKFGERWIFDGQDPETEVRKRIKESVGVRKDKINDGTIELTAFWDVTDYAKSIGRYFKQSRVDDHIRKRAIGHRKEGSREVHTLPALTVKRKVDSFLAKQGQPLPLLGLAVWQARQLESVLDDINSGSRTLGRELCGRFGKTTFSGALIIETGVQLTVITSYVLTAFTSFENDLSGFEQFKDLVLVDAKDDDYKDTIEANLAAGKQVVVFVSLCHGELRQDRLEFLGLQPVARLWLIDEADYGAKRAKQVEALKNARRPHDVVLAMTGTDADQATALWELDAPVRSVTYPELVHEKLDPCGHYDTALKYFCIDPSRADKVVAIEFYQAGYREMTERYLATNPDVEVELLGGWGKAAADVAKAKNWWVQFFENAFLGKGDFLSMNIDYQIRRNIKKEGPRTAMIFLPGSMPRSEKNDQLAILVDVARQCLSSWLVVSVYGAETSNKEAEALVKEYVERSQIEGKDLLILSAGMAQRSFSVGNIKEVHLCYDGGDASGTNQKIWRGVTPLTAGAVARIVSWSLDPNRDDKFDAVIMSTIFNVKRNRSLGSNKDALRDVLKTVNIYSCTDDGRIMLSPDKYSQELLDRNSISRVGGMQSPVSQMTDEELEALKSANSAVWQMAKQEKAQMGRTHTKTSASKSGTSNRSHRDDLLKHARKVITTIIENSDIIVLGTNSTRLEEAFQKLEQDLDRRRSVESVFNLPFDMLKDLFDRGIVPRDYVELRVDR